MQKYFKILKDQNILVNSHLKKFLSPKEIYIPFTNDMHLNIKTKNVKKNELLFFNDKVKIYSPISGKLKDIVTIDNQKYLIIMNNFKEEKKKLPTKTIKTKKDLLSIINEYDYNLKQKLNNLQDKAYLSFLNDNPYDVNNRFILEEKKDDILNIFDLIREIFKLKEIHILIKNNDSQNINIISTILGRYPNFKVDLIKDYYPVSKILYNEATFTIDEALILTDHLYFENNFYIYITLSGNLIKPQALKVKKGTSLKELLKELNINYQEEVLVDGLLNGKWNNINNVILTKNTTILFLKKEQLQSEKCLSCSKCYTYCPVKCNPILNKNMDKCLKCHLCEYLCPSHLTLIKEEKNVSTL